MVIVAEEGSDINSQNCQFSARPTSKTPTFCSWVHRRSAGWFGSWAISSGRPRVINTAPQAPLQCQS